MREATFHCYCAYPVLHYILGQLFHRAFAEVVFIYVKYF